MKDLDINMGIVITYIFGVRSVELVVPQEFIHHKAHCPQVVCDTT
jgi:hypothetical protein